MLPATGGNIIAEPSRAYPITWKWIEGEMEEMTSLVGGTHLPDSVALVA